MFLYNIKIAKVYIKIGLIIAGVNEVLKSTKLYLIERQQSQ